MVATLGPTEALVRRVQRACGARVDRPSQRVVLTPTHLKGVALRPTASVMMATVGPTEDLVRRVQQTRGARMGSCPLAVPTLTHLQGVVLRPIASVVMAILDPTEALVWRVRKARGVREGWSRRVGLTLRQLP
jgi:hypothetical protein